MGEISDDDIKQAVEGYLETNLAQPDWNQNDSTAKDYVKNRTHRREDNVLTEILPQSTIS